MARSAGCLRLLMGKEEFESVSAGIGLCVSMSSRKEQGRTAGRAEEGLGKRSRCGLNPQRGAMGRKVISQARSPSFVSSWSICSPACSSEASECPVSQGRSLLSLPCLDYAHIRAMHSSPLWSTARGQPELAGLASNSADNHSNTPEPIFSIHF